MFKINYNCIVYLILTLSFMFIVASSISVSVACEDIDNKKSINLLKEYKNIKIKEIKQLKIKLKTNDNKIKKIKKYSYKKHKLIEYSYKLEYKIQKHNTKIASINKQIKTLKKGV